ncbi:hypothetical protein P5G51_019015 [Virgibacillus sp. 179-BFC.A HS]|uniref:DUF4025 domain-containing protein n=1 Tax=Tigheibacillus jepli TaxID=3035914 RepID=A0ABU5CMM1_9BACI|nr:hypothetical protein [Virgibacillus sp. 179-BFC.A HS]MDY0407141.1 hypothetical protein [Virgibacillus sp. 179-BFC.A HS]
MPNKKQERNKQKADPNVVAPGIDPDDSYGRDATNEEIAEGEATTVTRLIYDEYDHS